MFLALYSEFAIVHSYFCDFRDFCVTLIAVEVKSVSFLKHLVDVVGHSVFTLLHEFKLTDIRLEKTGKVGIGTFRAFDVEPPLCVLQFADKAVVVGELFAVAPH